jgi:hypothetical protein
MPLIDIAIRSAKADGTTRRFCDQGSLLPQGLTRERPAVAAEMPPYNRTAHLPERRRRMQIWADHVDGFKLSLPIPPHGTKDGQRSAYLSDLLMKVKRVIEADACLANSPRPSRSMPIRDPNPGRRRKTFNLLQTNIAAALTREAPCSIFLPMSRRSQFCCCSL